MPGDCNRSFGLILESLMMMKTKNHSYTFPFLPFLQPAFSFSDIFIIFVNEREREREGEGRTETTYELFQV